MTKLYELLNLNELPGDFGIEIECEGNNLAVPPKAIWNTVDDGSLRGEFPHGRAEWVFAKPLSLDDSIKELHNLRIYQDKYKAELNFSFRTSVHVHMNVQHLTFDQYLNTIYTYILLENALVRYCGDERIGNRFCLRMQDAEGLSEYIEHIFRSGYRGLFNINPDQARYAALNVACTTKYGSLEFRSMRGNLEVPYISTWLKALYNIRKFACKFKNPQQIHDMFVRTHPSEFMEEVLGDVYRFLSYEDEVEDMRMAFSLSLQLPYAYTNEEIRQAELKRKRQEQEKRIREQMEMELARVNRGEYDDYLVRKNINFDAKPERYIPGGANLVSAIVRG